MSDINRLVTFVYDWMRSNGCVEIPSKSANSNRVRLDAWRHVTSQRPIGLEQQKTMVNFWLRRSDVPGSLPEGVKFTPKSWDGEKWSDPEGNPDVRGAGANSNLLHFDGFEGYDLVRLGVREIEEAQTILDAVFDTSSSVPSRKKAFLLKVNGRLHCPGNICHPASATEWEGGEVLLHDETPRELTGEGLQEGSEIAPGDSLWIWTHEYDELVPGRGLIATAEVGAVGRRAAEQTVTLNNVQLLPRPAGFKDGFLETTGSALIEYLRSSRHRRVYQMSEQDVTAIRNRLDAWDGEQSRRTEAATKHLSDWDGLISQTKGDVLSELAERAVSTRKPRPHQHAFRTALLAAYEGRCCVTGLAISEALEAAHILPHTGDARFDVVENGLLLRRDLHTLFDAFLWSINPETSKVVLAKPLINSPYREFEGKVAGKLAAKQTLRFHYMQFKKRAAERDQETA
ncbi:HNH endonuclease [Henriciella marina]|uniref:HNH endonuclease n=1 Tax=Henriciella marina TaxID=453851 RepID=A0ABT4LU15_9PROT|nr:HNH endonuclease [Henriciella marina]MCZ4296639.1 HNH endonuclease [Henriciella marina]